MTRVLAVMLAAASLSLAQHVPISAATGRGMTPPVGASRFGNILFPGGIAPHAQTHAGRLGGVISGRPPFTGVGPGFHGNRRNFPNRTVVVPYAVPVYYGDYGYGYGYAQQQAPNVTVVVPQQPTPSVVINQTFPAEAAQPAVRVYEGGSTAESKPAAPAAPSRPLASDKPNIYLIALKDSTVRQAIGYWLEDGTVHYVTPKGVINRVTLDQVDMEMSHQLNSERNLEFDLRAR